MIKKTNIRIVVSTEKVFRFRGKYNRWWHFLTTKLVFSSHLSLSSKKVPRYLYLSTISTAWSWTIVVLVGTSTLFFPKIHNKFFGFLNIQFQVRVITPINNFFESITMTIFWASNEWNQSTIISKFNYQSIVMATSTVVYRCTKSKSGDNTQPCGEPALVNISLESLPLTQTLWERQERKSIIQAVSH